MADGPDLEAAQAVSYLERNRGNWTGLREFQRATARRNWAKTELVWGLWDVPESELGTLPDVAGLDVVELGCGTAYWSAWLARRGARPVGVDLTPSQLETARAAAGASTGSSSRSSRRAPRTVPLPDASFDLAFSEYGASIWCDPYRWMPEAARLLRPGGGLVFLRNGVARDAVRARTRDRSRTRAPATDYSACTGSTGPRTTGRVPPRLRRPDPRAARDGFELEALFEVQARRTRDAPVYDYVTADWARQWPSEEIWVARKRA